jgi:AbiV family abortive infection protein
MTERGAQHGDAATEVLGNALRLYSDAKLLFENGRLASCASLSVLAIEELAKFMGMIGAQPLPVRSWRSHPDKHVGSASFLLRKRYQAALREVLEETGADPDADYRRLADMEYRDDEMALFDAVLARIVSDGSLGRFSRAHVKETDRVKQLGFYVDLDDQMRVPSTPSQVTPELAKDHLVVGDVPVSGLPRAQHGAVLERDPHQHPLSAARRASSPRPVDVRRHISYTMRLRPRGKKAPALAR